MKKVLILTIIFVALFMLSSCLVDNSQIIESENDQTEIEIITETGDQSDDEISSGNEDNSDDFEEDTGESESDVVVRDEENESVWGKDLWL